MEGASKFVIFRNVLQSRSPFIQSLDRFNFYQNRPEQNLQNYVGAINGIPVNGGQTSTQGGGGNALTGALGGALTGGALGGMLPASMLAAIPGGGWALAGLGGLMGLMG